MRIAGKLGALIVALAFLAPPAYADFCVPPKPPAQPAPPDEPCPACEPKGCKKCSASPVQLSLGTYTRDETDLSIRTTGFGITVSRSYDSGRAVDGPMGIGWTSSLTSRLHYAVYALSASTYQHRAVVVMPHGGIYEFTRNSPSGPFTPPVGRRDTLVQNADGTFDMTLGNSRTLLHFNTDGTLSWTKDEYGNAINYTYDGNGRVQRVADGAGSGRFVDVTWNSSTGRISSVTDSAARTVRYTYDATGNLESVADAVTPVGEHSSRYFYVPGRFKPLLSRVEDRWDRVISRIEWDAGDRAKSYTEGEFNDANPAASAGEKYRYFYPSGTSTQRVHSLGIKTFQYDAATGLKINDGVTYDSSGQVTAAFDDDGRRTDYTYDATGRLLTETVHGYYNSIEVIWTYTYDPVFPEKIATKKPNNPLKWSGTRFEYHPGGSTAAGTLKGIWRFRSDGVTQDLVNTFGYDARGRLTSSSATAVGPAVTYGYNAAGDVITVTRGTAQLQFEYDALGRMTKHVDEMGRETTYTYDAADRILTITLPKLTPSPALNFTTTFAYDEYDPVSQLTFTKTTDANGRVTRQGYDALGNLIRSVDGLGNATTHAYQFNLLKSITDANGNATSYAYDINRQLMSTIFPDGATETYARSARGRLNSVADRRGITTGYSYDAFGRMTSAISNQIWPSGGSKGIFYGYQGQKLITVGDGMFPTPKIYRFTYDDRFQIETEGYDGEVKLEYDYDTLEVGGPTKSYTLRPPAGNTDRVTTVNYTYDSMKRVSTISFGGPLPDVTISYNARGQYDQILLGNGMTRNFTYDDQGRLTGISHAHPNTGTFARYDYGYDYDYGTSTFTMLGQRVSMDPLGENATKYRYDAAYQLIEELPPQDGFKRYQYDAIGNRTGIEYQGGIVKTFEYYKNGSNPENSSRIKKAFANTILTYDGNGNQLNSATWDIMNRLTQHGSVTFEYDWRSRRTKRQNANYSYSGENVARIRDAATNVLDDFIFGPGIDEPLLRMDATGAKSYYVVDGLGSVVAEVNATGAVIANRTYDAWGMTTTPPTFGYTGRESGAGSLLYYRARYYDSTTGRFLSEDPLGYSDEIDADIGLPQSVLAGSQRGLNPQTQASLRPYQYVNNDPILYVDPSGLLPIQYCKVKKKHAFATLVTDPTTKEDTCGCLMGGQCFPSNQFLTIAIPRVYGSPCPDLCFSIVKTGPSYGPWVCFNDKFKKPKKPGTSGGW